MSYFKINITDIKDSIDKYKMNKMKYEENLMTLYNSLLSVDSVWNDVNTQTFIQNIKDDKQFMLDYLQSLDDVISELSSFIEGIELAVKKVDFNNKLRKIKFDNSNLSNIKGKFSNVIYYLNDAINQINYYFVGSNFSNMNTIYNLRSQLKDTLSLSKGIINDIDKFVDLVINEVNSSIKKISKIGNLKLDLNLIEYKSIIVDL